MCIVQRRNKVRWHLGQEISLPPLCSNLKSLGSSMYCFEKSAYVIVTFWPPAVIWRPKNCAPLPPSLRLWCYAIKIEKFSESKPIFKSERHEHLQFSNTIRHGSCTECQQRLLAQWRTQKLFTGGFWF